MKVSFNLKGNFYPTAKRPTILYGTKCWRWRTNV